MRDLPSTGTILPWQRTLMSPFLRGLPIQGLSISVSGATPSSESTICVSDASSKRINDLYSSLGEGPHWETLRAQMPVSIPDVAIDDDPRWPVFGHAIQELPVGALLSVPLQLGAAVVGVVDMYCILAQEFTASDIELAAQLGVDSTATAVDRATTFAWTEAGPPQSRTPELRREVHQATGMISVQLDCSTTEALQRLKAYAFANDLTTTLVANDVVSRRLNFQDLKDSEDHRHE
jgi:GAF domain-containing protein